MDNQNGSPPADSPPAGSAIEPTPQDEAIPEVPSKEVIEHMASIATAMLETTRFSLLLTGSDPDTVGARIYIAATALSRACDRLSGGMAVSGRELQLERLINMATDRLCEILVATKPDEAAAFAKAAAASTQAPGKA